MLHGQHDPKVERREVQGRGGMVQFRQQARRAKAGTEVDLWDHKMAAEMRVLQEIFAEVVDRNARVAEGGRILDANGKVVRDFRDTGLPALLKFDMPRGSYATILVKRISEIGFRSAEVPADHSISTIDTSPV